MKLTLSNCKDPDAYIEVGLKGTITSEKPRDRHNSHKASANTQGDSRMNQTSTTLKEHKNEDEEVDKEQMMNIL